MLKPSVAPSDGFFVFLIYWLKIEQTVIILKFFLEFSVLRVILLKFGLVTY